MNRKAFLACVLMCVILTGCETAKKISEVIKNPDIQVGSLKEQPSEITVTLLTEPAPIPMRRVNQPPWMCNWCT